MAESSEGGNCLGKRLNVFQHRVTEVRRFTEKIQMMFKDSGWYNSITERIIRCAIEVHKELGPGLVESVYEVCLKRVLIEDSLNVKAN